MKALSVKQPWAWLICDGIATEEGKIYKNIENRTWATEIRGRIFIHASKRWDETAMDWLRAKEIGTHESREFLRSLLLPRGAIIGEVEIIDCVKQHQSTWFTGPYGFVLVNPVKFQVPIPCKGQLGFFEVNTDLMEKIKEGNNYED